MLGEKLKRQRTKLGLTQQEMAEQLNVSRQAISNWENGENYPDISMLVEVSTVYGLSLDTMSKEDRDLITKYEQDARSAKYMKKVTFRFGFLGLFLVRHFSKNPKFGQGHYIFWVFSLAFAIFMFLLLTLLQLVLNVVMFHEPTVDLFSEIILLMICVPGGIAYGLWSQDFLTK